MGFKYDFSGWATKNDLLCSDGRTIRRDAFKDNDGKVVPLVWNHDHNDPSNVLGHALLKNAAEGVYVYGSFNSNPKAKQAATLLAHGDVKSLSIWANQLKQRGGDVLHGDIKEVSLVLAGANPAALIDNIMVHGEESDEEAIIYTGEELIHSAGEIKDESEEEPEKKEESEEDKVDESKKDDKITLKEIFDTLTDKQKEAVYAIIGMALSEGEKSADTNTPVKHSDDSESNTEKGETVADIFETLTDKQKRVVYAMIGLILEEKKKNKKTEEPKEETDKENDDKNKEDSVMKHNVFEQTDNTQEEVLSHAEIEAVFKDVKRYGSLKDSCLAHGLSDITYLSHADAEYGVTPIDYLFPDAKNINNVPDFIKREDSWVRHVMNKIHHTPFSRIKSTHANITEDEARAKGYIKGKQKKEEVFSLLKRTTTPTTIYKKQKLDRDDVIDITDFDVVAWLKGEMRGMLDEELARAFLVGDGRSSADEDKINELNIRPIWTDDKLYTIKVPVEVADSDDDSAKATKFIRAAIKNRKDFRGSGTPVLYTTEDMLSDMLLITDTTGRDIYDTTEKLCKKLRVSEIITVPVMEGLTRTEDSKTYTLGGIIVNLQDYNVGADKGGSVNMFDDFDIDFNQMKYLIETRCSGALIKPYSAMAIEFTSAT
jgi:hypothetical protein